MGHIGKNKYLFAINFTTFSENKSYRNQASTSLRLDDHLSGPNITLSVCQDKVISWRWCVDDAGFSAQIQRLHRLMLTRMVCAMIIK